MRAFSSYRFAKRKTMLYLCKQEKIRYEKVYNINIINNHKPSSLFAKAMEFERLYRLCKRT